MSRMRLAPPCAWFSRYRLSAINFSSSISGGPSKRGRSPPRRSSPRGRSSRRPSPRPGPPPPSRGPRFCPSLGGRASRFFISSCAIPLNLAHQPGPLQGYQTSRPQFYLRGAAADDLADQVRLLLLKFPILRASQNPVQPPMEAPDFLKLRIGAGRSSAGHLPIDSAQLAQELPRRFRLAHHADDQVFQFRRIRELLPFERPAEHVDTIFPRGFGQIQIAARLRIYRGQRWVARFRSQRQAHGNGFRFGARKILVVLFCEAVKQPLQFASQPEQHVPGAIG